MLAILKPASSKWLARRGRVVLDNGNEPPADRRRLSEADRANMELFLENLHGECAKFTSISMKLSFTRE